MKPICKILSSSDSDILEAVRLLRNDNVVSVPTETVYGLAANALSRTAIKKIFDVKGRPINNPLIVHFKNLKSAEKYIETNNIVRLLAEKFWPGPLTMVLPKKDTVPNIVTANLPSVAIRVSAHPVFKNIISKLDFPLAAPSANPFGYLSPTNARHVLSTLDQLIPAVVDGGACNYGIESTIIDLRNPAHATILRPGPISIEALEETSRIKFKKSLQSLEATSYPMIAPGMLSKHYSPKNEIYLLANGKFTDKITTEIDPESPIILNKKPKQLNHKCNIHWLSENGELDVIAKNLFSILYDIDKNSYKQIVIELVKNTGIGKAVNDRLQRAAAKCT